MPVKTHFVILVGRLCEAKPRLFASLFVSLLLHFLILNTVGHGLRFYSRSDNFGEAKGMAIQAVLKAPSTTPAPASTLSIEPNQWTSSHTQNTEIRPSPIIAQQVVENKTKRDSVSTRSGENSDVQPSESSAGIQIPIFDQAFAPNYPVHALIKGIRGTVTASFRVGEDGTPIDVEIISGAPSADFDAAVIQALANTRIKPGSVRSHSAMIVVVVFDPFGTDIQGSITQKP